MCSDLADNWNIDVAAELEEYLEDLESVVISFDGGKSTLNFAEAALMIQVVEIERFEGIGLRCRIQSQGGVFVQSGV